MNKELEKDFEVLEKDLDTNSGEAEKDLDHILKLKCNFLNRYGLRSYE